ncbi:class I SAM-dependent methyltransferase [Streptomyces sp. RFCAC02]|uniref:methyltransferase n=1 Tax=Streptomyces sp. RFCAC02 TaxID=2499143 RepID=UPI00101FA6C0|nr:class I SAM-dependent methyltransferase [Streptomyces sp. RFCAC02]
MSTIRWTEDRTARSARWHSENATPPPARVVVADDRMPADTAHRLAAGGTALLWRGDYHNARHLLRAMGRRLDRAAPRRPGATALDMYRAHRAARGQRARVLGRLVVLLDAAYALDLRRAPDVRAACAEAYGPGRGPMVVSLTELLGVIGARQWRVRGVEVPALGARVHPHYGVFSPVRGEYVDLVARAPLPGRRTAFDLGTGTGVLATVLARRGVGRVTATDISARARACARDNVRRLGLGNRVQVADGPALYPEGRADVVVCNPPWLPGSPSSALERGVYDADSGMLRAFLTGLAAHLEPGGEGWLILSDLAERLGLRREDEVTEAIAAAGLHVVDRMDTHPNHRRARDTTDPLHAARGAEVTSLWRLSAP